MGGARIVEPRVTVSSTAAMVNALLNEIRSDGAKARSAASVTASEPVASTNTDLARIHATLRCILSSLDAHDMLEITMAAVVDAVLSESTEPDWTGLCGAPSSGKTEVLGACRGPFMVAIRHPFISRVIPQRREE